MNSRPQIIKTNKNTDINFSFNLIPQKIDNGDIQLFTEQMKKVIKTIQPATVFLMRNTLIWQEILQIVRVRQSIL